MLHKRCNVVDKFKFLCIEKESSYLEDSDESVFRLGTLSEKKNGIMWEKFSSGGPPPPPPATPPVSKTPVIKKKSWVYFSFKDLRNIFGLHQKITI